MQARAVSDLRVLVVDDAAHARQLVSQSLLPEGITVDQAASAREARDRVAQTPPDVIVLEPELPDADGIDLLREISHSSGIPVIVLTSRGAEADRVRGLDHGAEDYIVKPFFPRELAARVRRVAARRRPVAPTTPVMLGPLEFEGLTIDRASREVTVDGRQVDLTRREFDLLAHLAATPCVVFTRDGLLAAVWRSSSEWQTATTITEHVHRIRQKIERDPAKPRWIITVNGHGYRFAP